MQPSPHLSASWGSSIPVYLALFLHFVSAQVPGLASEVLHCRLVSKCPGVSSGVSWSCRVGPEVG